MSELPMVLAIDPGLTSSAWIAIRDRPLQWGYESNPLLELRCVRLDCRVVLAVESMQRMSSEAVGRDVFDTQFWAGRFAGAFRGQIFQASRPQIKRWLNARKDSDVRAAICNMYGGESKAIGGKRCVPCSGKGWLGRGRPPCPTCAGSGWQTPPGPLRGVSGHVWSALAVAEYAKYFLSNPRIATKNY